MGEVREIKRDAEGMDVHDFCLSTWHSMPPSLSVLQSPPEWVCRKAFLSFVRNIYSKEYTYTYVHILIYLCISMHMYLCISLSLSLSIYIYIHILRKREEVKFVVIMLDLDVVLDSFRLLWQSTWGNQLKKRKDLFCLCFNPWLPGPVTLGLWQNIKVGAQGKVKAAHLWQLRSKWRERTPGIPRSLSRTVPLGPMSFHQMLSPKSSTIFQQLH
jgi:hypothetical protein